MRKTVHNMGINGARSASTPAIVVDSTAALASAGSAFFDFARFAPARRVRP